MSIAPSTGSLSILATAAITIATTLNSSGTTSKIVAGDISKITPIILLINYSYL